MSCTIGVYATHSLESLKPAPAAARRLAHRRSRFCRIGSAVGGPLQAFANWCARPSPPRPPRPAGHAWWTSVTGRGVGGSLDYNGYVLEKCRPEQQAFEAASA